MGCTRRHTPSVRSSAPCAPAGLFAPTPSRVSLLALLSVWWWGWAVGLPCPVLAEPGAMPTPRHPTERPHDILDVSVAGAPVPAPPKEFEHRTLGEITWRFHPSVASLAQELTLALPAKLAAIAADLGGNVGGPLEVRIARSPEEMRLLSPAASPPPAYAVGVAYPALGLIVLSTVNPESWMPPAISEVLTHELSHIALHRAVKGHSVPLWFTEGLAVAQAGEHRMARVRALWEAAIVDEILPIGELSRRFPAGPVQGNLAYAESADLVRHLIADTRGQDRLRELVRVLGEGAAFEEALLRSYHVDLMTLERDFRRSLSERFRVLPLVLTGTAIWGGIAVLVVVAFVRKRRAQRARLAQWEQEETAERRAMLTAVPQLPENLASGRPEAVDVAWPMFVHTHDPGVPTIEHDGQRHTLH